MSIADNYKFLEHVAERNSNAKSFDNWQQINSHTIITMARKFLVENNISVRKVPLKTIHAFITDSALESLKKQQQRWAILLANAVTYQNPCKQHLTLVKILRDASLEEVELLHHLKKHSFIEYETSRVWIKLKAVEQWALEVLNCSGIDIEIIIENLYMKRLIEVDESEEEIRIAPLGMHFIVECETPFGIK
ncbi:hypothetical protein [Flammeovirga kamogawensis]|uniref:DUF1819 family protein n=1 Tax=Flammeovirga kamogawensis TaxID=373891 RepID=A0ABX8GWS5_9BACT|nr:hypothetical protein [Flammeovirga kamogawensis]MBB6461290.1 hypothetical protein [Flammeovirga kamogawensis]QWG07848.1 hypothetical protein KM029_02590 [Flammeovirga kamogawensis]TRX69654.1 hypothetical protein EO216_16525 [Flammeovirga kamogawensis]